MQHPQTISAGAKSATAKARKVRALRVGPTCRERAVPVWWLLTSLNGCFGDVGCDAAKQVPQLRTDAASAKPGNPMSAGSALPTLSPTAPNGRYLSDLARSGFCSSIAPPPLPALVIHLFEAVVALIVTPIDEDRTVIDTRAILAPSFETDMVRW